MGISINDGRVEKMITETTSEFSQHPEGDIAFIYHELGHVDQDIRDALLSGGDRTFRAEVLHRLFTAEKSAFRKFCEDPKTGKYVEGYLECILSIYEGYIKNPPEDSAKDLDWLAERTAELVMNGIDGEQGRA